MKAFLIDPFNATVTEVEYSGDFKQIYTLIDAECFDCCRINGKGDAIFVDDEGLFKEEQAFFMHDKYPQPLAGRGLVLGCDMSNGETIEPKVTLEQLRNSITFLGIRAFPI